MKHKEYNELTISLNVNEQTSRDMGEQINQCINEQPDRPGTQITLRAHHLLCTGLFVGEGYSDDFSKNMSHVVHTLKMENPSVCLVCDTDDICSACPKASREQSAQKQCSLDSVARKDQRLLLSMGLESQKTSSYQEILRAVRASMTESVFQECCGDCSWYEKGLCSWQGLRERLNDLQV